MKVIVDLCVVPIGVSVHLAPTIAACETVLTGVPSDRGLSPGGACHGLPPPLHDGEDQHPHRQGSDPGGQGGQRAGAAVRPGQRDPATPVVYQGRDLRRAGAGSLPRADPPGARRGVRRLGCRADRWTDAGAAT